MPSLSTVTGLVPGLWKTIIFLVICIHLCHFSAGSLIEGCQKLDFGDCLKISKRLLEEVKETLTIPNVTRGFNCSADTEMELQDITQNHTSTASTCEQMSHECQEGNPSKGCCLESSQCLQNITSDLLIYQAKLQNFTHITSNLSKSIEHLLKAINSDSVRKDRDSELNSVAKGEERSGDTFSQRMVLCKLLHALKLRTVTINRVMNHLNENQPQQ
ncbi:interleukin-12 subunit alpha [Callorhinchus milii]|uniref:interleukin-12 subunit alpha n=1 Tax=Callorhinchus milii TaxID=7868 RepID=UPI0004574C35|nr:interleukin-12 subunit alpha [Callorhinchus milii]|eukprot:gi/632935149/ref/XP_007887999.1/ PREDICTED: interleukin-12 subunit alpha [Callorhinchus milii]